MQFKRRAPIKYEPVVEKNKNNRLSKWLGNNPKEISESQQKGDWKLYIIGLIPLFMHFYHTPLEMRGADTESIGLNILTGVFFCIAMFIYVATIYLDYISRQGFQKTLTMIAPMILFCSAYLLFSTEYFFASVMLSICFSIVYIGQGLSRVTSK